MIEQNDAEILSEERNYIMAVAQRGQVMEKKHESRQALALWLKGLKQAQSVVEECRLKLAQQTFDTSALGSTGAAAARAVEADEGQITTNGASLNNVEGDESQGEDDEEKKDEPSDRDSNTANRKLRLRTALEVEHMCTFFAASGYYQVKSNPDLTEPGSTAYQELERLETDFYERAKQIRKEVRILLSKQGMRIADTMVAAIGRW